MGNPWGNLQGEPIPPRGPSSLLHCVFNRGETTGHSISVLEIKSLTPNEIFASPKDQQARSKELQSYRIPKGWEGRARSPGWRWELEFPGPSHLGFPGPGQASLLPSASPSSPVLLPLLLTQTSRDRQLCEHLRHGEGGECGRGLGSTLALLSGAPPCYAEAGSLGIPSSMEPLTA